MLFSLDYILRDDFKAEKVNSVWLPSTKFPVWNALHLCICFAADKTSKSLVMKSVLNYESSCCSGSHFFFLLMWSCLIYSLFFLLPAFFRVASAEKSPFVRGCNLFSVWEPVRTGSVCTAGGFYLSSSCPASCPYLCLASETYKTTRQMRGLLSVLAGISGSKPLSWINWVLMMGRVGVGLDGTELEQWY